MRPSCRLCTAPASEGSSLCAHHREAAARFTVAFAPVDETTAAPSPAAPGGAATAASPPAEDPLAASLAAALAPVWEQIVARVANGSLDLGRRWPQLSCYFLEDRLIVRSYLSIVPIELVRDPAPALAPYWTAALAPGGALHTALLEHLRAHAAQLHGGVLQTLDLHLVVYADAALLNAQGATGEAMNLVTWRRRDDAWQPATLAELRSQLGHQHWRDAAQSG